MDKMTRVGLWILVALTACKKAPESGAPAAPGAAYDVLLRGGWIVDGSGNPRWMGDVAIRGDRIVGLGRLTGAGARETLDVSGLIVAR